MKKYIIFIMFFVLFPLSISAQELDLILECPNNIAKNEEFKCSLKAKTKLKVSAIEYEFDVPEDITYTKFEKNKIWEGDEENNLILLYTDENKTGTFDIGDLYFTASKDINEVKLNTLYLLFCDEEFNDHLVIKKEENVKKVKRDNKKETNKRIEVILCVIIVLIIGTIAFLVFRRRKKE